MHACCRSRRDESKAHGFHVTVSTFDRLAYFVLPLSINLTILVHNLQVEVWLKFALPGKNDITG